MRKLLLGIAAIFSLGGTALSADLPIKTRAVYPPAFSWSGFFIGGHIGFGSSTKEWYLPDQPNLSPGGLRLGSGTVSGFLGGGQLGFNYQVGSAVFGLEGHFSSVDISGETCNFTFGPQNILCTTKVNWVSTATARLGIAMDRALLYFKGGAAWANEEQRIQFFVGSLEPKTTKTVTGYVAGAGIEYALTGNWSARLDYDFVGLGEKRYEFVFPAQIGFADIRQRIHMVKFGVNYRFDWGSTVVANY